MAGKRLAVLLAASGPLLLPTAAHATEQEWHIGASTGFAMLDFPRGLARYGFGGGVHARYGLTDAIDFTMNATLYGYPDDARIAPGTSVGIDYVIDVSRWLPTIGVTAGFVDLIGFRCEEAPIHCGHIPMPAVSVPFSFGYRVTPQLPIGLRLEYQLLPIGLLAGSGPDQQFFVGVFGAFAR